MVRTNSYNSLNSNTNSAGGRTPPVGGTPTMPTRSLPRQQSAPSSQQTTPTKQHVQASPASLRSGGSGSRSQTSQQMARSNSTPTRSNSIPEAQPKKLIPVSNGLKGQVK